MVLHFIEIPDQRRMVQVAAILTCQAVNEYRVMVGAAVHVGVTPVEVKEIVYQAVPYVGMAKRDPVPTHTPRAVEQISS